MADPFTVASLIQTGGSGIDQAAGTNLFGGIGVGSRLREQQQEILAKRAQLLSLLTGMQQQPGVVEQPTPSAVPQILGAGMNLYRAFKNT